MRNSYKIVTTMFLFVANIFKSLTDLYFHLRVCSVLRIIFNRWREISIFNHILDFFEYTSDATPRRGCTKKRLY